jgi:hypothetical protein
MTQEVWVVLHGGHGHMPFVDYLYLVLLHLLAFAAVALFARFGARIFATMTEAAKAEPDAEKQEP